MGTEVVHETSVIFNQLTRLRAREDILDLYQTKTKKKTPWLLVRKRTIPTELPPLVDEVSANFCG
jgi:hypothetical protein